MFSPRPTDHPGQCHAGWLRTARVILPQFQRPPVWEEAGSPPQGPPSFRCAWRLLLFLGWRTLPSSASVQFCAASSVAVSNLPLPCSLRTGVGELRATKESQMMSPSAPCLNHLCKGPLSRMALLTGPRTHGRKAAAALPLWFQGCSSGSAACTSECLSVLAHLRLLPRARLDLSHLLQHWSPALALCRGGRTCRRGACGRE